MDKQEAKAKKREDFDGAEQHDTLTIRERMVLELVVKANSLKARRLSGEPKIIMPEKGGEEHDQMRIIH